MLLLCAAAALVLLGARALQPGALLHPDHPDRYLEMGEKLAAHAQDSAQLDHARRVLAMGAVLSHRAGQRSMAASCCIALASTHNDPDRYQQTWDLALLLDPSRLSVWVQQRGRTPETDSAAQGAEYLRLARSVKTDRARELYSQSGTREAIERATDRLGVDLQEMNQALGVLIGDNDRDACRGRVFYARVEDGESIRVLCPDHGNPIGGVGDPRTLQMLLAVEYECLDTQSNLSGWGAASIMRQDRPFIVPSIETLIEQYSIDPSRPYLVDGRWSANP